MDEVFKALSDPSRRSLLDALRHEDGRTLSELCELLPKMTRFGVMNHLAVLENAELVTTQRQGRHKLHFLNALPIRLIHDRWISNYAEPTVARLAAVVDSFEGGAETMGTPDHIYKAYIKAPIADVWEAITNADLTVHYFYATRVDSTWEPGGHFNYTYDSTGDLAAKGEIIAIDPPNRLEVTFHAQWDEELIAEGPVREVWDLKEAGSMVELSVELYDAPAGSRTYEDFTNGLSFIISGLKTLIETGNAMAPMG